MYLLISNTFFGLVGTIIYNYDTIKDTNMENQTIDSVDKCCELVIYDEYNTSVP